MRIWSLSDDCDTNAEDAGGVGGSGGGGGTAADVERRGKVALVRAVCVDGAR